MVEFLTPGETIALYRNRAGMTKKDLSELTGVSVSTISRYEKSETGFEINDETAAKIASVLNITTNRIRRGFDDPIKEIGMEPLIK